MPGMGAGSEAREHSSVPKRDAELRSRATNAPNSLHWGTAEPGFAGPSLVDRVSRPDRDNAARIRRRDRRNLPVLRESVHPVLLLYATRAARGLRSSVPGARRESRLPYCAHLRCFVTPSRAPRPPADTGLRHEVRFC